jgi:hypothetical protein
MHAPWLQGRISLGRVMHITVAHPALSRKSLSCLRRTAADH